MENDRATSFEWLRAKLEQHPYAPRPGQRDLVWADPIHTAAVSRDENGSIEIFIAGREIRATTAILRETLQHQSWTNVDGDPLQANRLVLPESSNLPGVAAFICAELLANGLQGDPQAAFSRTEPVVAALLYRQMLGNEVLTGLAGELLLLEALTRQSLDPDGVVECWYGSIPSARDVQLGSVGVEVKATSGSSSTHTVQGIHQVELGHGVDDEPETALYLLSVGIRWLPGEAVGGTSIPALVEEIAGRVTPEARERFLARLRQYGGDAGIGYDHVHDQQEPRYLRRLMSTFERLYDMLDERIRMLRSSDVDSISHVETGSITFRVTLPRQIDGEINPTTDMEQIAKRLLSEVHHKWR
jgi:hypothetical protein